MTGSVPGSVAQPHHRRAARVLLIDDAGRLLMFRGFNPADPDTRYWFTVGGGINAGETPAQAAARELREETGLDVVADRLGEPVRSDVTTFPYDGEWYRQEQEYFVHRVPFWDVDTSGFDVEESRSVDAHRWWSVEELAGTADAVYPRDIVVVLRAILEG